MPRELADVLHYFLPELRPAAASAPTPGEARTVQPEATPTTPASSPDVPRLPQSPPRSDRVEAPAPACEAPATPGTAPPRGATLRSTRATLPVVAVPIGDQDVVRAALVWNLTVEVARHGGRALLLRPQAAVASGAWPATGRGPMGVEVVCCPARSLGDLYRAAVDLALLWASEAPEGGLVFVQVPPAWLLAPGDGAALLRWLLLLTTCDPTDVRDTYGLAKLALRAQPAAEIGITVHGARRRESAQRTFETLSRTAREHLGRRFESYGLLVDDLHVYRAVVERRPIGLAHPQSLAARALHDVAGLLLEDARHLNTC